MSAQTRCRLNAGFAGFKRPHLSFACGFHSGGVKRMFADRTEVFPLDDSTSFTGTVGRFRIRSGFRQPERRSVS